MIVVILMAAIAFIQHLAWAEQLSSATVRLMITKKGLDYLNGFGPELFKEIIQSMVGSQHMRWKLPSIGVLDLTLKELDIKRSLMFLSSQNGVNFIISNVSLTATLNVTDYLHLLTPPIVINTTGLTTHLAVTLTPGDQGRPLISINNCTFNFGKYDVNFIGGSSIFNLLRRYIVKTVIRKGINLVCYLIKEGVEFFNQVIPLPPVFNISDFAGINYALVSPLKITDDYIISEHKGFIATTSIPNFKPEQHLNVSLPPFEPSSCVDKMACVWVTEYVVNTASYVYKRAGKLVFNITEDTIEDTDHEDTLSMKSFFKLDTSTFSLIVPQLFYRYGGRNLTLGVRAVKKVPSVTISKKQAMFRIPAAIDVYVNDSTQQILPAAFTMSMLALVNASIRAKNGTSNNTFILTANVSGVHINVSNDNTNIGQIDYVKINKLIKAFKLIQDHLLPSLRDKIKNGYEVKLVNNLRLIDPDITHFEGGLRLETDFNYEKIT